MNNYIGLHNHSDYSNIRGLDSINKLEKLIDRYVQLGYKGLAITDHECLGGHIKALKYVQDQKAKNLIPQDFKLILGNEIYLCRNGLNGSNFNKGTDFYYHFILLAKDEIGYRQMKELSSRAWTRSYTSFITRVPTYYSDIEEIVGNNKGHLIAQTSCIGSYGGHNFKTEPRKVENFYKWCKNIFGDDFFLEIQPNPDPLQIEYNHFIVNYGAKTGIPVIVTTDAHYLVKEERSIHKAYLNSNGSEREVDAFYASTYVMDEEDLKERLKANFSIEEVNQFIENTMIVGNKCEEFSLSKKQVVPRVPIEQELSLCPELAYLRNDNEHYPYINKYLSSTDRDDQAFIVEVLNSLAKKALIDEKHLQRIEAEMAEMWESSVALGDNISAYMRTVSKIVDLAWNEANTIVGPGRGSAGSQLNAYALGIIQTDPLAMPIEQPNWRFLNRDRPDMPDIDIDSCASKREKLVEVVINYFKSIGGDAVSVCTYGTDTARAALQTAVRSLGYEPELGSYLSSLVPIDRGKVRTLTECYYGDEEKEFLPIPQFVKEMKKYPEVWEIATRIEGLISRRGRHPAGIVCVNDSIVNYTAVMRSPDGQLTTQLELHDSESVGCLKFDCLTTQALDRIKVCLDLLLEYGYLEDQGSLKANYDKYLSPQVIDYTTKEMWDMLCEEKIVNVFQFDSPQGSNTIRAMKPHSLLELAQGNSLMRLMPEGKNTTPLQDFIHYKEDIKAFEQEIAQLDGTPEEKKALLDHILPLTGVCDSQESLMLLVMDKRLLNLSMKESNQLRKVIAKKKLAEIEQLKQLLYQRGAENGCSKPIIDYIWDVQISRQLGYSFSAIHTVSYSVIAVQQMNLAYYYPLIFWNTANLIVDSGGIEEEEEEDLEEPIIEEETEEELDEEEIKKKQENVNYGKIATAIGNMRNRGIVIKLPDINKSGFTFRPQVEENAIYYGFKGISKINSDLSKTIIANRPYSSWQDFIKKVYVSKPQMVSLIKAGCFDSVAGKGDRFSIMQQYIESIADKKKKLTLQNMKMLIEKEVLPPELKFQASVYNFSLYLKNHKQKGGFELDSKAFEFYERYFDVDLLQTIEGKIFLEEKDWDKIYKKQMEVVKNYIANHGELLDKLNEKLYNEVWEKYAEGNLSKWEMDSVSFYSSGHELDNINAVYGVSQFELLPETPIVDRIFYTKDGKEIPLYKLAKIAGTVIDKDKNKHIVTLLTPSGVVKVKCYRSQFIKYDKQIVEKDANGKKKVLEKSWFSRGNKLLIMGIRRGGDFIPKHYSQSEYPAPIMLITSISPHGILTYQTERQE